MEKAKDRMKLKLRNPTSPFPQAALAEANKYDHLFDDAAKNPSNIVRAMQELGENINITA